MVFSQMVTPTFKQLDDVEPAPRFTLPFLFVLEPQTAQTTNDNVEEAACEDIGMIYMFLLVRGWLGSWNERKAQIASTFHVPQGASIADNLQLVVLGAYVGQIA